jgi:Tfp pilus assembly ATPase PilU
MQTMDAALAGLVRAEQITRRVAESRAHSVEELRRLLGSAPSAGEPPSTGQPLAA